MKYFYALVAALALTATPALALDTCYSGGYYEPATSGEGIDIQVMDEKIVLYRYAYIGGRPNYWTSAIDNVDSSIYVFPAYQTYKEEGIIYNVEVGTITLSPDPDDNTLLDLSWDYTLNAGGDSSNLTSIGTTDGIPWCLTSGCSGSKALELLFRPTDCK